MKAILRNALVGALVLGAGLMGTAQASAQSAVTYTVINNTTQTVTISAPSLPGCSGTPTPALPTNLIAGASHVGSATSPWTFTNGCTIRVTRPTGAWCQWYLNRQQISGVWTAPNVNPSQSGSISCSHLVTSTLPNGNWSINLTAAN